MMKTLKESEETCLESVQERGERLELAIQVPDLGLWEYDLRTGEVYFSPRYKRQLGYREEEFGNDFHELEIRLHPEDHERVRQSLQAYLANPKPFYEVQYRLRHKDGAYRWMLGRAEVHCDIGDRPIRVLGCQLGLTERNRVEEDRARLAAIAAAIEWQAEDFQKRSGILTGEDPPVRRDQATALFRIFQEILTNVARHAQAAKVWVHLGEDDEAIVLEVEDDGVGISEAQLTEHRSLGLLGMRERALAFGGTVEIAGVPGQGTIVTVRMPLSKAADEDFDR
jgi:PAS domain S-box-containing protein